MRVGVHAHTEIRSALADFEQQDTHIVDVVAKLK